MITLKIQGLTLSLTEIEAYTIISQLSSQLSESTVSNSTKTYYTESTNEN